MAEWLREFDSGDLWRQVVSSPRRAELLPELTDRHLEILAGVASGRTYREIAGRLGLASKTVKNKGLVLLRKASPEGTRTAALARFFELLPADERDRVRGEARAVIEGQRLSDEDRQLFELIGQGYDSLEIVAKVGGDAASVRRRAARLIARFSAGSRRRLIVLWVLANA